jgi:hypothetical protein
MPRTRRNSFSGNDLNAWANHMDYADEMADSEARAAAMEAAADERDALEAWRQANPEVVEARDEPDTAVCWWRLANPELAAERDALDAEHEVLWDRYWASPEIGAQAMDDWQARLEDWTARADAALQAAQAAMQALADAKAERRAAWLESKAATKTRRRIRVKGLGEGKGFWSE